MPLNSPRKTHKTPFFQKSKNQYLNSRAKKVLSRSFLQWSEPTRKQIVFEACSGGGKRPKAKTKECNINKYKRFVTFQLHNNNKGTKSRSAFILATTTWPQKITKICVAFIYIWSESTYLYQKKSVGIEDSHPFCCCILTHIPVQSLPKNPSQHYL